jgi:hypothetical protein
MIACLPFEPLLRVDSGEPRWRLHDANAECVDDVELGVGGRLLPPRARRATRRATAGRRSPPPWPARQPARPVRDEVVVAHGA